MPGIALARVSGDSMMMEGNTSGRPADMMPFVDAVKWFFRWNDFGGRW